MKSKYNNKKTVVDNITFDSKKEANRYRELKTIEKHGDIRDLRLQVPFELLPRQCDERAVKYIADFVYFDTINSVYVIEDVKGFRTDVYKLKRKLFKYRYPQYVFKET